MSPDIELLSLAILAIGILFASISLARNDRVYKEKMRVLDLVHNLSLEDIRSGRDYQWRYDDFERVSYDMMILMWWRPVKSFYRGKKCIEKS